jgi:Zn-dependent protease/CBS domain-containing protein
VNSSIELGKILGIRIGINWSWLVVFALITWSLAADLEGRYDAVSTGEAVALAVGAAVLFFASLLAHELGHALQARGEGMEIEGITLWLFGGVAKFRGMFPSAGAEFRIAVAGPLVTLVIGVVFAGVAWLADLPGPIDGLVGWLGVVNLLLLVFNMLPALPLDGGRVLRAALWGARRDFASATRIASAVGRGFGFLFIGLGVVAFIVSGAISGAWLAFIGWFLLGAASAEARYIAVRDALGGLRVRDLMARDPASVAPDLSLGQFMDDVVWNRRYTTYPVVEDDRTVGLLPFRRVAEVPRTEWDDRSVRDCMIPRDKVPVVREDEEVLDALDELSEGEHRVLVLDGDRLVGLLSATDVARALEVGSGPRRRQSLRAGPSPARRDSHVS